MKKNGAKKVFGFAKSMIMIIAVLMIGTASSITLVSADPTANAADIYYWHNTAGGVANVVDGLTAYGDGYYGKAMSDSSVKVNLDYSQSESYTDNVKQVIRYVLFSPTPKSASWNYVANGDGLYIQLRNYDASGMCMEICYVSGGVSTCVQEWVGLGVDKNGFSDLTLTRVQDGYSVSINGNLIGTYAIPRNAVASQDGDKYYTYFGTSCYTDGSAGAQAAALKIKSFECEYAGENYDVAHDVFRNTAESFAKTDKTDSSAWKNVLPGSTIADTANGTALTGDNYYDYKLNLDNTLNVFTDFSELGNTTYDSSSQYLVYMGITKEIPTSAGYMMGKDGIYLLFRNYFGRIAVQVHSVIGGINTTHLNGIDYNAVTRIGIADLKSITLRPISGQGYEIFLNNVKVDIPALSAIAHDSVKDGNGYSYLSTCTWSNMGSFPMIVEDVGNESKIPMADPAIRLSDSHYFGEYEYETGKTETGIVVFCKILNYNPDSEKLTGYGIEVSGQDFVGYYAGERISEDGKFGIFVFGIPEGNWTARAYIILDGEKVFTSDSVVFTEAGIVS